MQTLRIKKYILQSIANRYSYNEQIFNYHNKLISFDCLEDIIIIYNANIDQQNWKTDNTTAILSTPMRQI